MTSQQSSPFSRSPENHSFPTPLHTSESQAAPSIISSRMTDIASEEGDDYYTEGPATAGQSTSGPQSSRLPNDPSRPESAMSSQTRPSMRSPPSRRGLPFAGGWKSGPAFGGPGGTISNTSRPPSATSRSSRTHVPSLAPHKFFRPMSSQRLQAQRSGRSVQIHQSGASLDGYSEAGSSGNRPRGPSLGSNVTAHRRLLMHDDHDLPPPSRDTEFSGPEEHESTRNATRQSARNDRRQVSNQSNSYLSDHIDLGSKFKSHNGDQRSGTKSPKMFRANFLIPAENAPRDSSLHNQPPRFATTRGNSGEKLPPRPNPRPGLNYQYFSGNTVFCWGGRFQNSRDRPVNIATGIFVVLPSVLFFVYSYDCAIFDNPDS